MATHSASAVIQDPFALLKGSLDVPVMVTLSEAERGCLKSPAIVTACEYCSVAYTGRIKKDRLVVCLIV